MKITEFIPRELLQDDKIIIPKKFKRIKIDIGLSHNAPNSKLWLETDQDVIVFGFEPNPKAQNMLKGLIPREGNFKNILPIEKIGDSFHLIPIALSNEEGYVDFYSTNVGDCGTSSLYPSNIFSSEKIKVNKFKLSQFLDLIVWDNIDYIEQIKIDCQGEDFNIIKGVEDYLGKVAYITFENNTTNQYIGTTNQNNEIDSLLKSLNFTVKSHTSFDSTYVNQNLKDELNKINYIFEGL
jgi:FkbM family methyltransferase